MASMGFTANPAKIATGTSLKTLVQLVAPTNQRVKVKEISISFDGTSNTATPIYVEVVRQTSAGTLTNTTTLRKVDPDLGETIQTACKDTATVEPTDSGDVPMAELVHPQTGFLWQAPYGGELIIGGGGRLGVRVTAGASVNANVRLVCEE
jgi:hypothetical protein